MKRTMIVEISADDEPKEICDLIGGRIWTLFSGKREVEVRIASEQEILAIALANADAEKTLPNGHLEPGAQYGY